MTCWLHTILISVWHWRAIPPEWKKGLVVPIWKGKGSHQNCCNYQGITLLSVSRKVLAHLVLMLISDHLLKYQRSEKSRFMPAKSTTNRILIFHVMVEGPQI